jgi:chromate transporter
MTDKANLQRSRLPELFAFFLQLGLTAFGGPAAHIALMEQGAVSRQWMSREEFLDLVGGCNLLPGPSSTQVAMALGYRRGRVSGLVIAGLCFILPASLATLALAWAYVHFGRLPQVAGFLYGTKPVIVAIVAQAILRLGWSAVKRWTLAFLGVACLVAAAGGLPPFVILLWSGVFAMGLVPRHREGAWFSFGVPLTTGGAAASAVGLGSIALLFLKLGVVVFGSGYVLLAFLKADLVDRLHWISVQQLLDAVTAGQMTPGPVFATSTFIGYLLHGWAGAAVATIAVFLPSFFLAGMVGALAGRIRQSKMAGAFIDGVNVAAVALMAQIAFVLGRASLIDAPAWIIAVTSAVLLLWLRVNATWLILGGAALGILLQVLH